MINDNYTILYTDDDEDDRDIFKDAANEVSHGLEITTKNDGYELMEMLKKPLIKPTILFLDLNMPGKNGYEVLKEIRESNVANQIPVIIFSTTKDEIAVETTRKLGANLYMAKPTSYNSLKKAIRFSLTIDWNNFCPSDENFVYSHT